MTYALPNCRQYRPTFILIAINIAIYAYTSYLSGSIIYTSDTVIATYGQVNELVFMGYYWQLFTSLFIHVSILHIGGNMLVLLVFGLRAEDLFTLPQYVATYFLSGLAGNVLTLFLGEAFFGPGLVSAGASGAIFGILGADTIYLRKRVNQSIIGALLFAFFILLITLGPDVNWLAHLGGLGAGILIGYVLAIVNRPRTVYHHAITYR
jgi:rhomboid protease GluP